MNPLADLEARIRQQQRRRDPSLDALVPEPCLAIGGTDERECSRVDIHTGPHSWEAGEQKEVPVKAKLAVVLVLAATLGGCWPPKPQPTPTPVPTPTPTPTPTPEPSCAIPPDEGWIPVKPEPGAAYGWQARITQAQAEIGDRCGEPAWATGQLLVTKLREKGACTRLYGEDMLMVRLDSASAPGRHQEWDVIRGDGCWITIFSGTWVQAAAPGPTPTPGECAGPMPLRTWPDGTPHWRLDSHEHGAVIDHTATYLDEWDPVSGTCPRCTSWGYGQIGGQPRCTCPVGVDGTPNRLCREDWLSGGLRVESRNGAICDQAVQNVWWLLPANGNCRLCSRAQPNVCGAWW